jgi:hypothetical protein
MKTKIMLVVMIGLLAWLFRCLTPVHPKHPEVGMMDAKTRSEAVAAARVYGEPIPPDRLHGRERILRTM